MGHPDSKDPSSLYAQGSTVQYEYTHTRQGHFFSHTRRDPSTKDGSSCREADKRMGHPDSKDPSSLHAQGSTVQYKYTHTRQGHFFSLTHVGTPRLKMGHLAEKLTKGWDIPTAKIPLVYMLKAQQFSTSTHTRQGHFFSLTHVGTPRLKMGHLAEKLTEGWGILTAKIPLIYMLKA